MTETQKKSVPPKAKQGELLTASGDVFDVEKERMLSFERNKSYIEAYEEGQMRGIGCWINIPPNMQDWHFVLFERIAHHQGRVAMMRQSGYRDAPECGRMAGSSVADERRLVLCAPPATVKKNRDIARQAKIRNEKFITDKFGGHISALQDELGKYGDVEVTKKTITR